MTTQKAAEAARRLRRQLDTPASLMGGETVILRTTDVAAVVDAILSLREAAHRRAALSPEGRPRKMNGLLLRLRTARLNGLFDASKALKMKDDGDSVSAILDAVEAALASPEGWPQGGEVLDERMKEINRARGIIEGLKQWRENVLTCPLHIEPDARRRIRELCTPPRDDHDRAVIMVLDDIERLIRAIATTPPSPKEG